MGGDANIDGVVNFADITTILGNWLNDYAPCTGPSDANGDGVVDVVLRCGPGMWSKLRPNMTAYGIGESGFTLIKQLRLIPRHATEQPDTVEP